MAILIHERRIWVPGGPLSQQGNRKHRDGYVARIQAAALDVFPEPARVGPIELEVLFLEGKPGTSPDTDNVLKLIQDSLRGIVYDDDSRIGHTAATAIKATDPFPQDHSSFQRLARGEEFLIIVRLPDVPTVLNRFRTT